MRDGVRVDVAEAVDAEFHAADLRADEMVDFRHTRHISAKFSRAGEVDRRDQGGGHAGGTCAPVHEELPDQRGAFGLQHAAAHLHPMRQPAIPQHVPERPGRTGLGLPAAEHHRRQPGGHRRAGAHRARLDRDGHRAAGEVPACRAPWPRPAARRSPRARSDRRWPPWRSSPRRPSRPPRDTTTAPIGTSPVSAARAGKGQCQPDQVDVTQPFAGHAQRAA